jgi:hypothetical protein
MRSRADTELLRGSKTRHLCGRLARLRTLKFAFDSTVSAGGRLHRTAFAQWLADLAGRPITGESVDGQGPTFTAEPEDAAG